jgi:hypothetical protein
MGIEPASEFGKFCASGFAGHVITNFRVVPSFDGVFYLARLHVRQAHSRQPPSRRDLRFQLKTRSFSVHCGPPQRFRDR